MTLQQAALRNDKLWSHSSIASCEVFFFNNFTLYLLKLIGLKSRRMYLFINQPSMITNVVLSGWIVASERDAESFLLQSYGTTEHHNSWNIDFRYVVHGTKSYSFFDVEPIFVMNRSGPNRPDSARSGYNALWRLISQRSQTIRTWNFYLTYQLALNLSYQIFV